jgi:DNA-binding NarL/FixJ family response regulator
LRQPDAESEVCHQRWRDYAGNADLKDTLDAVPVVLLAESENIEEILGALRLGVRGYIPTSLKGAITVAALRVVLAGGTFVPAPPHVNHQSHMAETPAACTPTVSRAPAVREASEAAEEPPPPIRELTQREMDVLHLLRQGKSNKAIAYQLSVSQSTVKVHIQHIMRKLKATNRTHVVCLANAVSPASGSVG